MTLAAERVGMFRPQAGLKKTELVRIHPGSSPGHGTLLPAVVSLLPFGVDDQ